MDRLSRGTIVTLVIAIVLVAVAAVAGVRTYGTPGVTLNGGITYGDCGFEVWGTPGHFCNED